MNEKTIEFGKNSPPVYGERPSPEAAVERDYDFSISDLFKTAMDKSNGFKLTYWKALIIFSVILLLLEAVLPLIPIIGDIIYTIIACLLAPGFCLITLNYLRQKEVSAKQLFEPMTRQDFAIPIVLAAIVSTLLITLGFILVIIPGIYLTVAYLLVSWIIIDNPGISFWTALETSRKAITKHFFKVFALILLYSIICGVLGLITFGIGLIWLLPWATLVTGLLYETIFGARAY